MALVLSKINQYNLAPGLAAVLYSVTMPTTLAASQSLAGCLVDMSSEFPNEVFGAMTVDDVASVSGGFLCYYVRGTLGAPTTGRLMLWQAPTGAGTLLRVTTGATLSTVNFYLMAFGK